MRRVMAQEWVTDPKTGKMEKKDVCIALFHQFGLGYVEFEYGTGNYSTAIIEHPNGQVEEVYANCIRFLDPI